MATADSTRLRLLRGSRLSAVARGIRLRAARIPLALAILLLVAVGLRFALWLEYRPAMMNNPDSIAYVVSASEGVFADPSRPAGYPMFMRALHLISDDLDFTILVQHLVLGLGAALLLYASVIRIGAPRWAALIAAASVLLSLDQIQLEHTLLSEPLFTFALALSFYAAVRALDSPRPGVGPVTTRHAWITAAGLTLGFAAWARAVGVPLVAFLALWFVVALPGRWWTRLGRGALAGGAGAAILVLYFSLNSIATGHFGLTQTTGWAVYGRTAPIADCSEFTPPPGTAKLCETTSPEDRYGPDFYTWDSRSPAHRQFGFPPAGDDTLGEFAREVVTHQTTYYGWVVFRDWARYFLPGLNDEQSYVVNYEYLDIDRRERGVERDVEASTQNYYPGETHADEDGLTVLTDLQQVFRVHPLLMLQAVALAGFGIWLARGRVRAGLVLLLGGPLVALLIASATVSYNARYVIPLEGPLIASGAVGLWVIVDRLRERRANGTSATAPSTR
jgi:4-amino-4-deoxy-L-arabinose transferase-like glycosyltransferase